jgi:hypothetical protein
MKQIKICLRRNRKMISQHFLLEMKRKKKEIKTSK